MHERISCGSRLSPQEIRSCICHGEFNDYLHELNKNAAWREIYGPISKRLKDIELILRFMAFYERGDAYKSPMKHFLNDYMKEKRNLSTEQLKVIGAIFEKTVVFLAKALGDKPFRPDRSLNTAVFDSVATALAHRLSEKGDIDVAKVKAAYDDLLKNPTFIEGYVRSTADDENVRKRMDEAQKAFADI